MHFIRTDHIHRPIFATNEAGAVVWQQSYDPCGRVISGSGSDMRFAGQWFAAENGLHQNWMRDYDATLGRYIQPDPLGLVDGASVYGYALQNPARWSDPTGEFVPLVALVGGLILGRAIDPATEYVEEQYCTCGSDGAVMPDLPLTWESYGAAAGATGPFVQKPRTGVAGGGKSGGWTSGWSTWFGSTKVNPTASALRKGGRAVARKLPYIGTGLLLYDAGRIGSCINASQR